MDSKMFRRERRKFANLMSWANEFLSDATRKENIEVRTPS